MSTPSTNSLASVTNLVSMLTQCAVEGLASATGESGLVTIEQTERELSDAAKAISALFSEAIKATAARAVEVRSTMNAKALDQVVALLNCGTITLADITARLNMALPAPVTPNAGTVAAQPQPTEPVADTKVDLVATAPVNQPDSQTESKTETEVAALVPSLEDSNTPSQPSLPSLSSLPVVPAQRVTAPYKTPVRFLDPVSGNGWSGRGPVPKWFTDLCVNGKTKEDFRTVQQVAPVTPPVTDATPAPVAAAAAVSASTDLIGSIVTGDANCAQMALDTEFDDIRHVAPNDDDIGDDIVVDASIASFSAEGFALNTSSTLPNGEEDIGGIIAEFDSLTVIGEFEASFANAAAKRGEVLAGAACQ